MHTREETRMALWMRTYSDAHLRRPPTDALAAASKAIEDFDKAFPPPKPSPITDNAPPDDRPY